MYGTAGIPDVIACADGRFCGFEIKNETEKLTGLQEATIRKILKAGGVAVIVCSVDKKVMNKQYQRYKRPAEEVHHIIPLSQGGTHRNDNLMSLCQSCHTKIHLEIGDR